MEYIIFIDSCADLPVEFIEEKNIKYLSLKYNINGQDHEDDFGKSLSYKKFYDSMRAGADTRTSQINAQRYYEEFKKWTEEGYAIVYIGFSSGLSGSVNSAVIAKNDLTEEGLGDKIYIIDSKCASLGYGLLVYYSVLQKERGASPEGLVKYAEDLKLRINHYFTVEDLVYLYRGGRVSKAAKTVGTLLDIKPVLHVDDEGKLIPLYKVKGRKKSIKALFTNMEERIQNFEDNTIAISHGDCIEDVNYLVSLIREKFPSNKIIINNVGTVIGSHSGPGTLALFFVSEGRN
ncbi:MAG: DegV family protein [Bacillota bacterium]|nr:DegV family protein [Bacillota bacterium]